MHLLDSFYFLHRRNLSYWQFEEKIKAMNGIKDKLNK